MLSVVDGEILQHVLPVRVCYAELENVRIWSPALFYSHLRRIALKTITSVDVKCLQRRRAIEVLEARPPPQTVWQL